MHRRVYLSCLMLFLCGTAGGWLATHRSPESTSAPSTEQTAHQQSDLSPSTSLPHPSGLPGDLSHLKAIANTRGLRAAWAQADARSKEILMQRWLELDPADGLRFLVLEMNEGESRDEFYGRNIASAWGQTDPEAFLHFANQLDRHTLEPITSGIWEALRTRIKTDPESLIAYGKIIQPGLKYRYQYNLFSVLLETHQDLALREIALLPFHERQTAWSALRSPMKEPETVLRTLLKLDGPNADPNRMSMLIRECIGQNPAAAEAILLSLPPGAARRDGCHLLIEKLAATDPNAALSWMEAHDPTNENRRIIATTLLKTDLPRALALGGQNLVNINTSTNENGGTARFLDGLTGAMKSLAARDWTQAVALTLTAPSQQVRTSAVNALIQSLDFSQETSLRSLEEIASVISQARLPAQPLGNAKFKNLDPEQLPAISTWLANQPETIRSALTQPLIQGLTQMLPAAKAIETILTFPPSPIRTSIIIDRTAGWAGSQPEAAATFVLTLPPSPERDYAILNTAIAWQRQNPQAAESWLQALPDSAVKTKALHAIHPND